MNLSLGLMLRDYLVEPIYYDVHVNLDLVRAACASRRCALKEGSESGKLHGGACWGFQTGRLLDLKEDPESVEL